MHRETVFTQKKNPTAKIFFLPNPQEGPTDLKIFANKFLVHDCFLLPQMTFPRAFKALDPLPAKVIYIDVGAEC